MRKAALIALSLSLLLTSCGLGFGRRLLGGGGNGFRLRGTELAATATATPLPSNTPVPTPTVTLTPTPNPSAVGLPTEQPGTTALDFVASMCRAQWSTPAGPLPCPSDESKPEAGFVMQLPAERQGLQPGLPILLTYPPQAGGETIFGKYPAFTVQNGDRFRAVLTCRLHSFCDVEFGLLFYSGSSSAGLAHWAYRFTDAPLVIDYSLDALAGQTVQLGLSLRGVGTRLDAYGVWLMPHVYRP